MKREEAFSQWIGSQAFESDAGWTEEVWNTAWDSALLEAASRLDQMFGKNDTTSSISIWLRAMSEE
jgi:hypothetical protein